MSSSRGPGVVPPVIVVCAPDDQPAARMLAARLGADGVSVALAAELAAGPRALLEALAAAPAVVFCLSRRGSQAQELAPALATALELLPLLPRAERLLIALRLAAVEPPAGLASATALDLFSARGYERLRDTLRAHVAAVAPPALPEPEPIPDPPPALPALRLSGGFGLPALERQGLVRRLGRGVARGVLLLGERQALVISGGGPALLELGGGPPRWAIDCPTRRAALSPSGRLLALAFGNQLALWDLEDGQLLGMCLGHSDTISDLAFAPDERSLVSASHDRSIRLWRLGEGPPAALATILDSPERVTSICFSPDGATIAAGGADRCVRLWRTLDRSQIQLLPGLGGAVEALAFSPNGAVLAAASRGRSVRLWDARSWAALPSLESQAGAVELLAFSPDGATLAVGSSDGVTSLWRYEEGALFSTLGGHSGPLVGLAFSADGATLATISEDERLLIWELARSTQTAALRPFGGAVSALALGPDGRTLAVAAGAGALTVYDLDGKGGARGRFEHRSRVQALAFTSDGRLLSAAEDRSVRSWGPDGMAALLHQGSSPFQGAVLEPQGQLLAATDGESTVQLWRLGEAHEGARFWRVLRGSTGRSRLLAFGPRGGQLAVAGEDGSLTLWRLDGAAGEQERPALTLRVATGSARCVAFGSDERLLAAGGDGGAIQIWALPDGALVATLQGQRGAISSVALSTEGRVLAAGTAGGTILVWRLPGDGRKRQQPPTVIGGHSGAVVQLVFSPAGLVSGSADGTVRLWKL